MRKFLLGLACLSLLLTPAFAWDAKVMNTQIHETNFSYGDICSATLIDAKKKFFATAAHCVAAFTMTVQDKDATPDKPKHHLEYRPMFVSQDWKDPNTGTEMKRKYVVTVVGVDRKKDVAVLRVTDETAVFTIDADISSDPVYVGDTIYTIGNPKGLEASLSRGIIANNNRDMPALSDAPMYQIDVAGAAPGSSGCIVYNDKGEAIATLSGGYQPGLVFVVPIKHLVNLLKLIEEGKASNGLEA